MQELVVYAPTYYRESEEPQSGGKAEFDEPYVPVVVRPADGIRIVLGTRDYFDHRAPDVQIERRSNGWAIFLNPIGGGDPSGCIYFLDDGRSFVAPERDVGTTPPIRLIRYGRAVPGIDPQDADE
jgi:hypothetical protein